LIGDAGGSYFEFKAAISLAVLKDVVMVEMMDV
jgi:hypothetical protein